MAITSNADVAIVKSVTPTTTAPGTNVTYTMVVTNNGPSTAKDVKVSDPLPAGMTFVSVTPAALRPRRHDASRCSLGDLTKGQSVTITLVSGVPASLANKTKTNTATVSSPTPDSNLTNNKDDATVTVTGAPPSKLLVRKTANPKTVGPGQKVVFTIVLKVPSKVDAKNVDVCDTLPAELVFDSAPGATFSKGRACWHIALAKAGSTTTLQDHGEGRQRRQAGRGQERRGGHGRQRGQGHRRAPVKVTAGRKGVKGAPQRPASPARDPRSIAVL